MKKTIFLSFLLSIALLIGCKKTNKQDVVSTTTTIPNKQNVSTKIDSDFEKEIAPYKSYLNQLQGGYPNKFVSLVDAEFFNLNNKSVKLSDYKGQVIFLNLWATWCPPCKGEMPSMQKLHKKFKNKLVILGVDQGEDIPTVKNFINSKGYTFPIFVDTNQQIGRTYGTRSIPTTWIINKEGYVIARFVGARDWFSDAAIKLFEELLK